MKKLFILIGLALALFPFSASAVNVTVPSSPGLGSVLYGKANGNYATLTVGANGDCLKVTLGIPAWGSCGTGGGGGTDGNWSFFNGSGIRLATTSNQVLIGASSTTTLNALEVIGRGYFSTGILAPASSTIHSLSVTNGTTTNATTTKIFSTTASSTNLFSLNATSTSLGLTGITSSLLKTTATGGVTAAISGTDFSNFGASVGPTELQATDFGDWTCNGTTCTLDATYLTANQTITLSGDASGSGTTGITVVVADDSHAHTGTTLSGIDISSDTNLSGDTEIVLTGDALSIASTITRDTELSAYVPTSRQLTINGTAYDLSADRSWTISSGTVSTSTAETKGQLPYWTSTNGTPATLGSVATTSVSCSGDASCTPFTVIGSSPITITSTGGAGGSWATTSEQYYWSQFRDWSIVNGALSPTTTLGILVSASSSITRLSSLNATSTYSTSTTGYHTNLGINSEYFTDLTGTGLSNTAGVLTNSGVTSIVAGSNVTVSGATGAVTVNATNMGNSKWATTSTYINPNVSGTGILINSGTSTITNLRVVNGTTTNATSTNLNISGTLDVDGLTSALTLAGATGIIGEYAGASCTNQFPRSQGADGAWTCATVANTDLANSTISGVSLGGTLANLSATDSTLTFSGTYTGATARTIGLNLGNANTWTALQTFQAGLVSQASSTIVSLTVTNGTTTNATTTNLTISGISGSTQCLQVDTNGKVSGTGSACGAAAGSWATSSQDYYASQFRDWSIVSGSLRPTTTLGVLISASSTIGDGTAQGGLTISGNSTTTGSAYVGNVLGVNTTDPKAKLHLSVDGSSLASPLYIGTEAFISSSNVNSNFRMVVGGDNTMTNAFVMLKARNTVASPTVVALDDKLGAIIAQGYDGAARRVGAQIDFMVDGTPGSSDMPGRMMFSTTPDGSGTHLERMRITNAGYVGMSSSTPFAGLSIGSGNGSSTRAILVAEHRPATSTSMTIDWKMGNTQNIRLGNAAMTVSFSNFSDGGTLKVITCNPPTGTAGAVTWGTQVLWSGGTVPTQTTTAQKCDVWSFQATQATSTLKIFGTQTPNF